jgi:hypothetical protein
VSEGSESQLGPDAERPESMAGEALPAIAEGRGPGGPTTSRRTCPWCSAQVPDLVSTCPTCHAVVDSDAADEIHLPGLTEVSPELLDYAANARAGKKLKPNVLSMLLRNPGPRTPANLPAADEADALRPPSPEVRAEMARIEAEIAGIAPPDVTPEDPAASRDFPNTGVAAPEAADVAVPAESAETASAPDGESGFEAASQTDRPLRRPPPV